MILTSSDPEITIHPSKISYVSKQHRVVKLHCQAKNTDSILWKCNGKVQKTKQKINQKTKTVDGVSFLNSYFNVKYSKLENYLGFEDYSCRCLAIKTNNRNGTVQSEPAIIHETYLNKKFRAVPKSGNVMKGEPFLLKCKPPYGEPEPTGKFLFVYSIHFTLLSLSDYLTSKPTNFDR